MESKQQTDKEIDKHRVASFYEGRMRIEINTVVSRLFTLLIVLMLACGLLLGPLQAQTPPSPVDPFAKARSLEATSPTQAFDAYQKIKSENDRSNPEVAAQALLLAAHLAASPKYGTTEEGRGEGEIKAHEAVKQLLQQFPNSHAARVAAEERLKETLEAQIDKRNSKTFNYQLVASLVKLTGSVPGFSYWFALLLIALIVKGLTTPLTLKMYKSQREQQRIQPFLKELNDKYKGKPEYQEKVMATYKEHGINPFASCLPMFIQLPFMIWIYNTIRQYEFHFGKGTFLWIGSPLADRFPGMVAHNLAEFDVILLTLYAASNWLTMKMTPPTDPQQAQQQKSMAVFMTLFMFWMFMQYRWSAAFIFYWLILNLISTVQQYYFVYKPNQSRGSGSPPSATGGTPGQSTALLPPASGNGALSPARPVTPVPGGNAMRARPRRKRR